jgi:hypothetical protein
MAKTINQSSEQAVTAACTRALERGRDRVKLPAAVVRGLMVELRYNREQAKARYEGMVSLTTMINKMAEIVEEKEARAVAAEKEMNRFRMQSIDAGLSLASANGAARNALDRATTAEADVREMADAIRDLRDRVAAAEAESKERLAVIRNLRDLTEEYSKSFRVQEVIVHNARNEALELGRKLDAAETETVAATKRAEETAGAALKQIETYSQFLSANMPDWKNKLEDWLKARNG